MREIFLPARSPLHEAGFLTAPPIRLNLLCQLAHRLIQVLSCRCYAIASWVILLLCSQPSSLKAY